MNGVCEKCGASIELSDDTLMDFGPWKGRYICADCWVLEPIPDVTRIPACCCQDPDCELRHVWPPGTLCGCAEIEGTHRHIEDAEDE